MNSRTYGRNTGWHENKQQLQLMIANQHEMKCSNKKNKTIINDRKWYDIQSASSSKAEASKFYVFKITIDHRSAMSLQ